MRQPTIYEFLFDVTCMIVLSVVITWLVVR